VATHGVHCVTCDTSDIPQEGVPLEGEDPIVTGRHQPDAFQSPIDSSRQSPLTGTDGASRRDGSSNTVHYYPQQQNGQQAGLNDGRYQPEDQYQNPDAYAPQDPYQEQGDGYYPDYGTGYGPYADSQYDPYDYTGYGNRKRRSLKGKTNKPVKVVISRNAASNTTLLKMVPILRNMRGRMMYDLKHGNRTLFTLNTNNPGMFFLATARKMDIGKYILGITGDYRQNYSENVVEQQRKQQQQQQKQQQLDENMSSENMSENMFDGIQLNLKVVVSVV